MNVRWQYLNKTISRVDLWQYENVFGISNTGVLRVIKELLLWIIGLLKAVINPKPCFSTTNTIGGTSNFIDCFLRRSKVNYGWWSSVADLSFLIRKLKIIFIRIRIRNSYKNFGAIFSSTNFWRFFKNSYKKNPLFWIIHKKKIRLRRAFITS